MKILILKCLSAAILVTSSFAGYGQSTYPFKTIRIQVGATAGGGTDAIARLFAEKMGTTLGQSIIIDNKPGAANTIAADITARAAPDGYTLLMANNSGQVIAPHLLKLGHDPLKQLTPIGMAVVVPHVIVVNDASPIRNFNQLLAEIKSKPDRVRFATSGVGSVQHMATEIFMAATGTTMTHIPYKGSSQAHQDILGGQVEIMFDTTSSAINLLKAGKFRALAVTTPKRATELPDVPTLSELGIINAEMSTWYAMYAPAETSAPVVERLVGAFTKALQSADVQSKLRGMAGEPGTLNREQFITMQTAEDKRFSGLIKNRNIKLD